MKLLIILDTADADYATQIKKILPHDIKGTISFSSSITYLEELAHKSDGYDAIVTTSAKVLSLILGIKIRSAEDETSTGTINDYAGKIVKHHKLACEVLILLALKQQITTSTASFLNKRYLQKLLEPSTFLAPTSFCWELVDTQTKYTEAKKYLATSDFIVIDIETGANLHIKCCGFAGFKYIPETNTFESKTFVLPIKEVFMVHWMRELCILPPAKCLHNGMYDVVWLLMYSAPVVNWKWDTLGMFHSWYVELPRSLDFVTGFLLRDVPYWKNESGSNLYEYNAKDCWATGNCMLAWMQESPDWAKQNYLLKFPEVFPSLCCEMEGIKIDSTAKEKMSATQNAVLNRELLSIRTMLGYPEFNPASPIQIKNLLTVLGCKDLVVKTNKFTNEVVETADAKVINKAILRGPLQARILGSILKYKKAKKALSTYIDARLYKDRFLYRLNPFGTESGRSSSSGSSLAQVSYGKTGGAKPSYLHYGTNIQNMPRDSSYAKAMMIADTGFLLCEIDKSASESYCTALLSGDKVLWDTLHSGRDFHCSNAAMFFGIPYEELYDDVNKKVLNKPLRQLAKPVNHGANYNMGANVLVETMGEAEVYAAKQLLLDSYAKYPSPTSAQKSAILSRCKDLKSIAQYLLNTFHSTYKGISSRWYLEVENEVRSTSMIKSPSGWTRYCFNNPTTNKRALNSYIAHGPQHLSVMLLNKGFYRLFKELQDTNTFRLKAQIHDSIFFQYREGREDLVHKANEILMGTIIANGKSLTIPNDASYGKLHWSDLK